MDRPPVGGDATYSLDKIMELWLDNHRLQK